jgi:hypothetical protein
MDAFAPPSIRAETSPKDVAGVVVTVVLTLVVALSLVGVPGPPAATLDASWQEMLIHAHLNGLQFGKDIIFTWGPLGFLCSHFHMGRQGALALILWQSVGQLGVASALTYLTRELALGRRLLFTAALLAFHWLFQDTVYLVLIALITLAGLMRRDVSTAQLIVWVFVLGFLSQVKFTYMVLAAAGVVAAATGWALRDSSKRALVLACGYAIGVLGSWMAAGQNLDNFYPYLRRSLEITSGYGSAMALDEPTSEFIWGATITLLGIAFSWDVWRSLSERAFGRPASVFLAFSFYVIWKEAFTRADLVPLGGHIFGLISFDVIVASVATGLFFPARRVHWFDGSIGLCLIGLASFDPQYYARVVRVEWQRIYGNVVALDHLSALPAQWQQSFEQAQAGQALPGIKAAVGRGSVDVLNFQTGIVLLNGLDLRARPIFQSYTAYTPSLEGWNLRFFQSSEAPDFLLWNDEEIDMRFPSLDDALLVAALPGHYEPLFSENGYWLFRKVSPAGSGLKGRQLLTERTIGLSEMVQLPAKAPQAIWLQADCVPSTLGRLRSLLYKPALLNLVTVDEQGRENTWRLLPQVAAGGFLLMPTLLHGKDLVALTLGEANSRVGAFRIEAPGDEAEFWSRIKIKVFMLPELPLRPLAFSSLQDAGIVEGRPLSAVAAEPIEVIDIAGGKALFLHAPGSLELEVPKNAVRFAADYGLRDGSYTGEGHTAGVEFVVEALWPSGRREPLWRRTLDPVANPRDRGTQHIDVQLPSDLPSRLIVRTGTGGTDDNRWDWSYVAALRFEGAAPQ